MKKSYICKCGKQFYKNSSADTTGYLLENYQKGHECFGCPYVVEYADWQTGAITKRECRATPQIDYTSYCRIGTEDKDFTAAHFYTLDLALAKRIYLWCQQLEGCAKADSNTGANIYPEKWRAADFDNEHGLIKFSLYFENNKKGTAARRDVKERFFGRERKDEKENVLAKIQVAIAKANGTTEELRMNFNFGAMLSQENQIKQIPLDMLIPYHNHKFKLYDGERLEDMIASIKGNGVLAPCIVRPMEDKYEILSGHNRCNAAKLAGLTSVPAIIKENLSDDEAEVYVIETNVLQRGFNDLRTSEQAAVLALRYSQMFSQGKRNDIINELKRLENPNAPIEDTETTCTPMGNKSIEKVGAEYGLSKNSVARLLRIDKLIDELKEWVDINQLAVRAGVELSYISSEVQNIIYSTIKPTDWKIDIAKAKIIRQRYETTGSITPADVVEVFAGKETQPTSVKIKVRTEVYQKYFSPDVKPQEVEDTIVKALELYFQ